MLKKGMTTSIMILAYRAFQITRCWYYQKYRDAGYQEALMITYASGGSTPGDSYVVRRPKLHAKSLACGLVLFLWAD
jgi:hypothetical protein